MKTIQRLLSAIYHRINILLLEVYFLTKEFNKNKIYLQYSVFGKNLTLGNRNFGDDINRVLVQSLFNKIVIPYKFSIIGRLFKKKKYMCVGSVITMFDLTNTIIWGTGVLGSSFEIKGRPKKVCAVRGPLSRQYLLDRGISCPEVYGDPALFLPRLYFPTTVKKYRIGIIAHYLDHNDIKLKKFLHKYQDKVLFIDVVNYGTWKQFIDKILSCELILSSSLHGLIVSDAYGIPNHWCQIHFKMDDDGFKFRDYFFSVNKQPYSPFVINSNTTIEEVEELYSNWKPIDIDLDKLIESCPFQ